MTLDDVLNNWGDLSYQKKRQALQTIVDFIDYEDEDDGLILGIIRYVSSNYEQDDYFGTEGLKI